MTENKDIKMLDLRSDTVSIPENDMLKQVFAASYQDNFLDKDKSTKYLEEYCADLFGYEKAIFILTGTLANHLAIKAHTKMGDEILVDNSYHISYFCSQAIAELENIYINSINTPNGILKKEVLLNEYKNRTNSIYKKNPGLICIENTINYYSGAIYPTNEIIEVSKFAREHSIPIHMDGARIFNAIVAGNLKMDFFSQFIDSVMISFTKGLGTPVGAMLLGNTDFIENVKINNKRYGGALHQSGILAEMCMYAIKNNFSRLQEDHEKTLYLINNINFMDSGIEFFGTPETNILVFEFNNSLISPYFFYNYLNDNGIKLFQLSDTKLRAVIHKDISINDITYFIKIFEKGLKVG